MKLIVGLGNPEKKYKYTPHNIGFLMIDYFLEKLKKNNIFLLKKKKNVFSYFFEVDKQKILLFKPQLYMNLSGIEIKKIISLYQINIQDIFVLSDDIYLSLGKFKLKKKSGHGGHNGIKNIIENLNTNNFIRLKIGVGYNSKTKIEEYVLQPLDNEKIKTIMINFDFFSNILINFIRGISFEKLINISREKF
ncbi:peptidyl-tRNA hydrolase [Candidatus Phytoplasma oryzae]|uniref:Peptidyl-tRNA hydrolase n=1 Tax=Candidatus Phytoplasma oryzae TaxID=203274 RepID=A0A139JQD1_9MOLU|nr:aminoacyl-tRNA hydrolase [Candidatus Phytoplasma oryzae]KXT29173.1 peptidyl-tRNA hydrolase [Candidatus Phytoplasma oryzae]RAM58056.1 hypothetical protein DH96_00720 [Candidatus Phytoplasma oryzae]